jgi:hypothetical protein
VPEGENAESPAHLAAPTGEFRPPTIALPFQWRTALRPILIGGAIILAGSMVPLGALWYLLAILAGAMAAVALYRRQPHTDGEVPVQIGAKIGAAAALLSFSSIAILIMLLCVFAGPELRQQVVLRVQATQSQMTDAQSRAAAQSLLQQLNTPEGFATLVTLAMALLLIFFLVFGAAGGALSAKFFGRSRRRR